MSKFKITNKDLIYAKEFKKNLYENENYHSPSLQRILNLLRTGPIKDKEVLFRDSNRKIWYLASLPGSRGRKIKINYKKSFSNILDAEWYVFKKRWKKHTGKNLII